MSPAALSQTAGGGGLGASGQTRTKRAVKVVIRWRGKTSCAASTESNCAAASKTRTAESSSGRKRVPARSVVELSEEVRGVAEEDLWRHQRQDSVSEAAVSVSIVRAAAKLTPPSWQLKYEVRDGGHSPVDFLRFRQDGRIIELSLARAKMQPRFVSAASGMSSRWSRRRPATTTWWSESVSARSKPRSCTGSAKP